MNDTPRWVIVLVIALVVLGLLLFARGRQHHRGDDVGALGSARPVAATVA